MPGVSVRSAAPDSLRAVFKSITTPSASFGATDGSTSAVQAVVASPSIARLGSPKLLAGELYGVYGDAALVSSSSASGCASPTTSSPDFVFGVVLGAVVLSPPDGVVTAGVVVAFGVGVTVGVNGIFVGFGSGVGASVVGVPIFAGAVPVGTGVTGVVGVVGVVATGGVAWAIVVAAGGALECLFSAAYAAVAAP